uniref:Coiled-coil domain-containing protein C16orf93 homolog n=1 Tax=Phallusia mammillata TaxID=59560 RepID=A0A6F9D9B8_9ASCI|nr:coiled-coil domain-containing protein C16orf93 homolog [Phallusia mammillata]
MATLQIPTLPKPKLCIWADLNVHNTDQIMKCGTTMETRKLLQRILTVEESPRGKIILDLYQHAIRFAILQKFTNEQASAFFSIVKQTHEVCVSTPFGNVEECFTYFRELVLTHAVHRPPWSLEIFNSEQVTALTNYIVNHYFRHYKLYKYAFTAKVRLDLTLHYDGLPPSPPPEMDDKVTEFGQQDGPPQTPEAAPNNEALTTPSPPPNVQAVKSTEHTDELESLVRKAVTAQLKQMHAAVEQQLADTDKSISDKIQHLEQGGSPRGKSRSPKASPKGKRR